MDWSISKKYGRDGAKMNTVIRKLKRKYFNMRKSINNAIISRLSKSNFEFSKKISSTVTVSEKQENFRKAMEQLKAIAPTKPYQSSEYDSRGDLYMYEHQYDYYDDVYGSDYDEVEGYDEEIRS